ncbi:MAG: polysaccharide biosynthesis tyrosine autokinase [Cyclobacteriaceae bacterium]|nr:polysaccharide biosynthesis tyrosine autokinase [Cyclobacteriaceae bacterium]UYN85606.1 MAG: polysaccharide biosynthesis tyrosine autokinase [Cyclobacteriaceae bacterium]
MENSLFNSEQQNQSGFTLDFKRVIARALRFWYVVILSLSVSLIISFYKTRYSERVYPVSASILIREMQETGGAELLYKNALIDPYRNYLNEPYIIRSYPLIEKVVKSLNFHVSFYREGYFMTTEAYSYIPVKAEWCNPDEFKSGRFIFKLIDENHYSLRLFDDRSESDSNTVFTLGDSIQFGDYNLCIRTIPARQIKPHIGVPFLLSIQNPTSVAGSYIGRLKVEWAAVGAGIINLSLTGTNPEKEIDFLDALIKIYRNEDLDKKNEAASRTIVFIKDQLIGIKDSLKKVEYQLERFGNTGRVKDMSAEAQRLFTKLEVFEVQKAELMIRNNYYQYLEEYLQKGEGRLDQIILPSSMGISDPVLSSLLGRMIEIQQELKLYTDPERGRNNPLIQSKLERITSIKKDVEEAIRTLRSTDKIKTTYLIKQLEDTERQIGLLPASERQLISVQRNYSLLENLYVFLMQKLSEAEISRASNTSDIIPVNPPMQGGAISPKPTQSHTIAFILGLAIPFGLFVLFEIINNKVQSKEDIEKMTTIPFLGGVGHNSSGNNLTVLEKPKSGVAESFRAMRSNLNYFTGNKVKQVFMVSSSISGEGKTFTTINLATVFALSGKRTLIVGADMRRPKIFEDFDCRNEVGLSTYLSGLNEFDQVVQPTKVDNLYLVSGGPVPPNPSELLLADRFGQFIKSALEKFEYVIIDTPPLALVTDAFVISKHVDHTVFVLRQNYSPKQFISSINEYYLSGKIKSISILLNDIYKSGLGYGYGQGYAYNYGYSYGYGYGKRKNGDGYYSD